MDLLSIQLYPAKWRGVAFDYTTGTNNAGRKIVLHEYPNKDERGFEDLGKNLKTLSITAVIHGINWLQKKSRFEDALNIPGIGVFKHPAYGDVDCVMTGYTVTDDYKLVGAASYEITFAEVRKNIFPTTTDDNKSLIAQTSRDLIAKVNDFIAQNFSVIYVRNIQDAGRVLDTLVALMQTNSTKAKVTVASKSSFQLLLDDYDADKYRMPSDPVELGSRTESLTVSYDGMASTTDDRDTINQKLFGFGEGDSSIVTGAGGERGERNYNRQAIYGAINCMALANLYENAILQTYPDESQLNSKITDLEDKYERLAFGETNTLDDSTSETLQELRDEWRKYYEELRLSINKIQTIITKRMPLRVLLHQYYNSIDNYDEIMALNNIKNPALVSGEIKILER